MNIYGASMQHTALLFELVREFMSRAKCNPESMHSM